MKALARVPRNLFLVGLVSLLTDASTEMIFPLLPLFLTTLGGGALAVGVMEGTAESVSSFLKLASGRLSDRWNRRKGLTMAGYGFSALTKLGFPFALVPAHVVGLRSLDRVGKGIRGAPRDALIADSMPRSRWGFAFGFHRVMDTTGAVLGPLAAALLVGWLTLREIFWVAAIPAVLSVLVLLAVREPRANRERPPPAKLRFPRDPRLFSYLLTIAVFTLGNFGFLFLLLEAAQAGVDLRGLLLVNVAYNLTYVALALPLGAITDRIGRVPILALAFALLVAASMTTAYLRPTTFAGFLLPAMLFGLSIAGFEGNGRALAVDLAPVNQRASVLGAYHATIGLASLPAGILMGLLGEIEPQLVFITGGLFAAVALLELIWLWSKGTLHVPHAQA